MREIKFRGKSVDTKEWIYGGYYEWDNKSYIIQKDIWDRDIHTAQMIEVIPETVGQYIGVKDNNGEGEEIYEGDIITGGDGKVLTQILWVDEYGGWGAKNLIRNEMHALDKYFKRYIGEVIGNIYENPNLLGG